MAESEPQRQERVIRALVLAGVQPSDAVKVVEEAAKAEQRLPTDSDIADDAAAVGTAEDVENSRQWWWWTLTKLTAWSTYTRVLDAQPKEPE